jgi:hypothetical protein
MNRRMRVWSTGIALLGVSALAHAKQGDPCDFVSSGATAFSHEQVTRCYRQVPFDPAALANIVQVVEQHRSFSDLAEIYDARVHWRQALAALVHEYPNDLAMHDALKHEHQQFRDGHISYVLPACYWTMLAAFVPFDFGSTVSGSPAEQIVFIESAPFASLYLEATGIDATSLVGQRVVSINGVPVLDYFRQYSEALKAHEDAGGGLNGVLSAFTYSVALGGPADFVPERAADEYVFESVRGQRTSVTLPWAFIPSAALIGASALPLTHSSDEFIQLCQEGPPEAVAPPEEPPPSGEQALRALSRKSQTLLQDGIDRERQQIIRNLRSTPTPSSPPSSVVPSTPSSSSASPLQAPARPESPGARHPEGPTSYYEVPPERIGQDIEVIVPFTDNAAVLQYAGHVTALQLLDTVGWIDVARQGVDYACEHSDRLIVDLRNNGGGNDTVIRWLHHYLFPERGQLVPAGLLPFRLRNDNPVFDEVLTQSARFAAEYAPGLGVDPCALFLTPGCLTDPTTGVPLVAGDDWFAAPSIVESRAGQPVSLSRYVGLPNIGDPEFDAASCAGRFQGDDLVFITDGTNASGGYFLPAAFENEGVIVGIGGYVGEPMAMGRARGGATVPGSLWAAIAQALPLLTEGALSFENELVGFTRPVDSQMEMAGIYLKDGRSLHIDHPVNADLHVNVWTNLPGSEGFVYERVLEAVDAAGVELATPLE